MRLLYEHDKIQYLLESRVLAYILLAASKEQSNMKPSMDQKKFFLSQDSGGMLSLLGTIEHVLKLHKKNPSIESLSPIYVWGYVVKSVYYPLPSF